MQGLIRLSRKSIEQKRDYGRVRRLTACLASGHYTSSSQARWKPADPAVIFRLFRNLSFASQTSFSAVKVDLHYGFRPIFNQKREELKHANSEDAAARRNYRYRLCQPYRDWEKTILAIGRRRAERD